MSNQIPNNLKYAESHEWILVEGDVATVGITDHAQAELSDVVFVDLPEVGNVIALGDNAAVVESVKAASDIYAPITGEVLEVNEELGNDPALINTDPYGSGWIYKVKISDASELEDLMSAEDYGKFIA